jgi:hypothetical protein
MEGDPDMHDPARGQFQHEEGMQRAEVHAGRIARPTEPAIQRKLQQGALICLSPL